ncbi:MAG: proton-conducting membrane transporter [Bacteroidales bacterium]|nr:proton-conducting membrane transporter [Bacteroidales bacterium]
MKKIFLYIMTAMLLLSGCNNNQNKQTQNDMNNPVIETIMARRSIRAYKPQAVEREIMNQIVKCGINAPNGMNAQPWEVRIVDNPEFINGCTKIFVERMKQDPRGAKMVEDPSFKNMFRNAPTVVFIALGESRFAQIDCGLMAQNMMLAAKSLGIGSIALGSPVDFFKSEEAAEYYNKLEFPENYTLALVLGFGYPDESPEARPRDESKIRWIE